MDTFFTDRDLAQIESHGIAPEQAYRQMEDFRRGFPPLDIIRPAVVGDGIVVHGRESMDFYAEIYRKALRESKVVKFVPASGAATRMFKDLYEYVETSVHNDVSEKTAANIGDFAFYDAIAGKVDGMDDRAVVQAVLDYGARLPKGLIAFHKYPGEVRTAAEEHLVEGAQYASANGGVNIHFTVSPEHEDGFRELFAFAAGKYEKRFGVKYRFSFSHQNPATDTIAAGEDGRPFRQEDGSLLFRPAGHGALIGNLAAIDADIIFIKNIDNVTVDRLKSDTVTNKMVLGGMLVSLRKKVFNYIEILDRGTDRATLANIRAFVESELFYALPAVFDAIEPADQAGWLRRILDRPLRICAMVRNEGEPGGGPFWAANSDGSASLHVCETSQAAPGKRALFDMGTHFNPVDIACATKDYKGRMFELPRYVDPETGFISEKSHGGRKLRALELPGLWNGAMSAWNTVFVEAPVSTFTPVKTVADLLRPQHR